MATKIKLNKSRWKGVVLADVLHLVIFVVLSVASAFAMENMPRFLLGLLLNAATAHSLSRLYVSFSFLNRTHGNKTYAHLVCGMLAVAYALPGWYKLTFPYHAMGVFQVGGWVHSFDLCYRTLCYVGQLVMISTGFIMLRNARRMPWTFLQTFSYLLQVQFGSVIQHLIILSYTQNWRDYCNLGTFTFLTVAGFVSSIASVLMSVGNYVHMKKAWSRQKGQGAGATKATDCQKEDIDWMDIFLKTFVSADHRSNPPKWSPSLVRFADGALILFMLTTASLLVAQANFIVTEELPGLLNEASVFNICAVNDTFILGFLSALGFDTTLQYHRKVSDFSAILSAVTSLLAFIACFSHAGYVLTSADSDAFWSVSKDIFWPFLGSSIH